MPMCMSLLAEDHHNVILFDTSFRGTTSQDFISKNQKLALKSKYPIRCTCQGTESALVGVQSERSSQSLVGTELQCLPGWQGYALWKWGREERQGNRGIREASLTGGHWVYGSVWDTKENQEGMGSSSLTLQVVSPGQGGSTWAGQGGEGLSGAAHAVPAL